MNEFECILIECNIDIVAYNTYCKRQYLSEVKLPDL